MSMRLKFILLFTIPLLAGLGTSAAISYHMSEQAMVESALTTMDQANLEVSREIGMVLERTRGDLLIAMEHPAFTAYFELPESRAGNRFDDHGILTPSPAQQTLKKTLDGWILSLQKRLPMVETCLIDHTGQEHARVANGQAADPEAFSSEESQTPFFQPTMALEAGQTHLQAPYLSPDADQWVFSQTSPIVLADGTKAGFLHAELPVALIQGIIRRDSFQKDPASHYFILNAQGRIVADSRQEISLTKRSAADAATERFDDYLPSAANPRASTRWNAILERMQRGENGSDWFEDAGERQHIAFRPLPAFDWSIGHIRPHGALLQGRTSLHDLRLAFILTALAALLLAVTTIWVRVGRITAPLRELTDSVEKIAHGSLDFSQRVPEGADDEPGILARAFNQMLATLDNTTDSKEYTEQVLGAMVDGLLVLDREIRIQRVNTTLVTLLEETEEKLIGRHLDELLPDPSFCAIMYRDLLSDRLFRFQETTFFTSDGREVAVSISSSLLRDGREITGTVILVQDIRQRKRNEEQLHFLANFDMLTQLPNRTLLLERLSQALARAPWRSTSVGLLHCALDRFKTINESLGHRSGDELLKETANRLKASVRDGDTVARVGGDEFLILLQDVARAEDMIHLARKISHAISLPLILSNGQEVFITASIGISLFPENGTTPDELLKNADIATQFAKAQGKNQFSFFSTEMNRKGAERLSLERDLRRAIERGELEAHYQPRWDLQLDRLAGAEALVRWRRGGEKLVSPAEFLPLAEELGLMEPIDLWMMRETCRQARQWLDEGRPPLRISVNLSHYLFGRDDLVAVIRDILEESGLKPHSIELELTEAIVMNDMGHAMKALHAFREMGIHLAVDDFGTGYSSFSHLRRLPVHILKIDRSFVREITTHKEDAAITHAIISLAHTLGLRATAEGAEEQDQRDLLTKLGCDELQGYLISRPLPAREMEARFLRITK
ncbi:MAG: EAL domain-containing protein [Magnetococcales bacterium]|nr:EAL domain-containing protein [Magnetococcales bacterium]